MIFVRVLHTFAWTLARAASLFAQTRSTKVRCIGVLLAACAISGCNKGTSVTCSTPEATSTTLQVIKDALQKETFSKVSGAENGSNISKANIRALIAQLSLTIDDIRTSRKDPNSTKQFCEGSLKIRFPAEVLSNADEARSNAGLGTISQLADTNDVDREANSFSAKTDYDVQPTDEGDKVFAETDVGTPIINLTSEILSSALLHGVLQQAAIAVQQEQQQQQAQQNAALNEQKAANLNSAKTDDQLASQSILAVWRALPAATRAQLLPQQRAWARKKDADCHVEAASASTDPTEMEVARLNCDAHTTQDRIGFLQQIRSQTPDATSTDQQTDSDK